MSEIPKGDTPTPGAQPGETPPAGGDTPPQNGGSYTPPGDPKNELEREKARAATAQQRADDAEKRARDERIARIKAEKQLKALQGGAADDGQGNQPPASGAEDAEGQIVKANAEKNVYALVASNQAYQQLVEKDPTLKEVLLRNPLSLISEYIDAEDAAEQVKKFLDSRLQASTDTSTSTPPTQPQQPKDVTPPGGGGTPPGGTGSKYTADSIRSMSPADWAKIPKEERMKMMQGNFN